MGTKIILTGATGMVGEGVLLECLDNPQVDKVLSISRRPAERTHPKLEEYLVPKFFNLQPGDLKLQGYDACFFCAGVSSVGMNEEKYTRITYDTTIHFAKTVQAANPGMTFIYVSGRSTDSTEKGRVMWARVKGKTENDLAKMPFKKVYNFRPAIMKATPGQKHLLTLYKRLAWMYPVLKLLFPGSVCTLKQVGQAMINCVTKSPDRPIAEVKDIKEIAAL